ncbi:restriction endonuclease subunit S [Pseudomonas protegens]|uniref:restriction endonuclease subunit S n=1 Tax=Pseudomonas protegens TaxID=380021 RepID=UPI002936EC46|nr:restriction endonuclease subunit S [Pseudomonas protegens]WOE79805.1 restriction endonuclease subunit S [Pseudomonas protegens]
MSASAVVITPYNNYVESSVEWLGYIPATWSVKRMRLLFRDVSVKDRPQEILLSVTQDQGVVPRDWVENRMVMPSGSLETFKFIEEGDFAISLRSFEGGLEYCHRKGIISPAYTVLKAITKDITPSYYRLLFKSHAFISELQTSIVGIREGKNISYEELKNSLIPIPSLVEQIEIANFLDQKSAHIEQAIKIKERQIERLKERKQILIQQAITRGLDPYAPMRDSGIEWIGQIPLHWSFMANRALFHERVEPGREDLPLLSVSIHSGVSEGEISEDENIRGRVKIEDKSKYIRVLPGDIAFNMMRAWQGAIGAVRVEGMVSPAYTIAVPCSSLDARYFEYQYRTPGFIQQMDRYSKGITDFRKRLYWDGFKQLVTLVPPIEEQRAIVEFIEQAMFKQNAAVALLEQQITKLKEYKATLINSAVTGKIKVPGVVEPDMLDIEVA